MATSYSTLSRGVQKRAVSAIKAGPSVILECVAFLCAELEKVFSRFDSEIERYMILTGKRKLVSNQHRVRFPKTVILSDQFEAIKKPLPFQEIDLAARIHAIEEGKGLDRDSTMFG